MQTVIRNVSDINDQDRQALEHVLGQQLSENQQLVIQVVKLQVAPIAPAESGGRRNSDVILPEWCNVYAGLSDDEIAELEKAILTRADLTRSSGSLPGRMNTARCAAS